MLRSSPEHAKPMPRGMGKARQGKGRALPLPADWHRRSVTSAMAVPRRTPFRPVPGVYTVSRMMSRTLPRDARNRRNHLFPNVMRPVALSDAHRYARDIAGRRPFATRHPVYCAAHRCIFPMYRFGADVTALAKLKSLPKRESLATERGRLAYHARVFQSIRPRTLIGPSLSLSLSFFPSRRCHPVAPPGMPRENPKRRALMARSKLSRAKLREAIDGGAARCGAVSEIVS